MSGADSEPNYQHRRRAPKGFSRSKWETWRDRFQLNEYQSLPREDRTTDISETVSLLIKRLGLESELWQQRIFEEWKEITGELVASHSRPGRIHDKTLVIFVSHPIWLQELQRTHYKTLLEKIQAVAGAKRINKLRFQLDPDG